MINFNQLKETDIKDKASFKTCIGQLTKRLGNGYNLDISKRDNYISYSICHNRSPLPTEVGEIALNNNNQYKIKRY